MISERVEEIISLSKSDVSMDDGFTFNQHDTIKRINYYINSKFLERNDNAIFWNLSNSRITHFAKNIDLDTKDLQPYGVGEVTFVQIWILKMKFYKWLEENKFTIVLNDLAESCAAYGSSVWKVVQDEDDTGKDIEECNLRNLYFDPTCESIRETSVVEMHYLTALQLKARKDSWQNIDLVLEQKPTDEDTGKYDIWEFWGEYEDENEEIVYGHRIGFGEGKEFISLYEDLEATKDDSPYYDFHIGRYFGRWMRVGVVERLFKLQERINQLVNQNAQASEIASLLLLRTANGDQLGNVLTDLENGQVIQSDDLQQIGFQNPGMNQFIGELQLIERQADVICLTPQVVQGEQSTSSIPFRSLVLTTNSAKSAFRFIKERIGEQIGYILKEEIFPDVVKNWNSGEIIDLAGDEKDVKIYDQYLRKATKWQHYVDTVLSGRIATQQTLDAVDQAITNNIETTGRRIDIPKNFFNFDYLIRTNITGEQVDMQQKNDAYYNALQMVIQNPAIINTPMFKQYVEDNDINWWRLSSEDLQSLLPQPPQMPQIPGMQQQTMGKMNAGQIAKPKQDALMASVNSK